MPLRAWKVNNVSDLVLSLDNFYRYKLRHVASATLGLTFFITSIKNLCEPPLIVTFDNISE